MHKFNIFLCCLGLITFVLYNVYIIYKNGFTKSLSATYYTKEGRKFMIPAMSVVALSLWLPGIEVVPENYMWTIFLAIAGFIFVIAAPRSRDSFDNQVHTPAAIISGIGTQLFVLVTNTWLLYTWFLMIPLYFVSKRSLLLWTEYICFGTAILSILFGLL